MTMRQRKLAGAVALVALIVLWVLFVGALAALALADAPGWLGVVGYAVAGLGWVLPAMPLVRWMQRPDD